MLENINGKEIFVYDVYPDNSSIKRGEIRYVDFGYFEEEGTRECGKTRPAIIYQIDEYNEYKDAYVAVIPLSTSPMYVCIHDELLGLRINVGDPNTRQVSIIGTNRLRFIDRSKIGNLVSHVPDEVMQCLDRYYAKRLGITNTIYSSNTTITTDLSVIETNNELDSSIHAAQKKVADMMDKTINPDYIRQLSIKECTDFILASDILGVTYFKDTPKYNDRTFAEAVKTAKTRVKRFKEIEAAPYSDKFEGSY